MEVMRQTTTAEVAGDGSTLTTVSFNETTTSSSAGETTEELETGYDPTSDKKENGVQYFHKSEGSEIEWSQINVKGTNLGASKGKGIDIQQGPTKKQTATNYEVEEESHDDEEVVELEFETAVERIHTHDGYTMHCPYCRGRITKVVLRRKVPKPKIPAATNIPDSSSDHEILGCASCLSFFVSCGNKLKLLNPLRLFGAVSHDGDTQIPHVPREPKPDVIEPPSSQDDVQAAVKYGWRYNLFWFFGNGKDEVNAIRPPLITPPEGEIRIPVHQEETPPIATQPENYRSLEIVKSIVYGGLMESIVSLSIVSSSAAANATTLNIVVLALANLVGGLVILAHNLKDLRYGENDQISEEKYKKELGRKEYFPLHATVAILSYIVFGLVAPLTYGFTFRETNDRDFKMLAAGIASLVCIFLLGIAKAYTKGQHKFSAYFKTVTYYVTCAVLVSGIAFAIGELARKLVEKYGLFACPSSLRYEPADLLQPITWASY